MFGDTCSEAQALGVTGGASSSGPQSWPPPPAPSLPAFNVSLATPMHRPAVSITSLSPEIASAKERVAVMRAKLATENVSGEPTNSDLMHAIIGMKEQMALKEDIEVAKLETVKEIRSEIAPLRESTAEVDTKAVRALDETKMLHDRMVTAEQGQIREFDRVGRLETEVKLLKEQFAASNLGFKRDKFDPAFVRVRFHGFKDIGGPARIAAIDAFMRKNFSDVRVAHTDHFSKTASFVQLATPKIAKRILDDVKEKKLKLEGFPDVKISQALTAIDISRNICLHKAEELVTKDGKSSGKKIETKKGKDRGVYVDDIAAVKQDARYDPRGGFVGEYTHLKLP